MKNILFSTVLFAILIVGCNQKNKQEATVELDSTEETTALYSCPMHPEVKGKKGEACSLCGMDLTEPVVQSQVISEEVKVEVKEVPTVTTTKSTFSTDAIVNKYLVLKNSLVKDDSKAAALAAEKLVVTLNDLNSSYLGSKGKASYDGIAAKMIKDLKHISGNAGKIDHQREYFALVSKDITDLIKTFGTDRKLYKDYCPMYDGGKSGYWISETKEIKNPYYGSEMLSCGGIVETLK